MIVVAANYLTLIFVDRMGAPELVKAPALSSSSKEGFVGSAEETRHDWLNNKQLYDKFYASVYDLLVQPQKRSAAEVSYLLKRWTEGTKPSSLRILDAGCGTGISSLGFAKEGCAKVIALDSSEPMLEHARTVNTAASTLTDEQRAKIDWRRGDLNDSAALKPSEVDAACLLYFTTYYVRDLDVLFRNLALWVRPGGHLAVHVVNKHKFDPMLDAASPFMFSLQKYSKERLTKSKVKFDKFDYEAEFGLDPDAPSTAEFRETFRFKDNTVRRQQHNFFMPDIPIIVNKAKSAGWFYKGFVDQTRMGFEYSYLLMFSH
jgi:SAM-dependent methyltransferase